MLGAKSSTQADPASFATAQSDVGENFSRFIGQTRCFPPAGTLGVGVCRLYRGTTENDVGFRLTRVAGVAPNE